MGEDKKIIFDGII